ncbi:MAG: hypothetical protein ACR2HJ_09430 [Fimbriimonadales bacterium]
MIRNLIVAALATVMTTSFALGQKCSCETQDSKLITSGQMRRVERRELNTLLVGWKAKPREVAEKTIAKYGEPHEATATRMVWFNSGPWKFTILTNEEIPHNFPMHHHDMLRQGIDYRVPDRKFNDLLNYDGSVVIDRTPGEISARCDKEEMNFLAINLAIDVATGKRSVSGARDFYAKTAMAFMKGSLNAEQRASTSGFTFRVPQGNTGFPDKPHKGM